MPSVTQHRDVVGDELDLLEPMRDQEDRSATISQAPDDRKSLSLSAGVSAEVGSSSMSSWTRRQRAGDLDELQFGDRQACNQGMRVDVEPRARATRRPPASSWRARGPRRAPSGDSSRERCFPRRRDAGTAWDPDIRRDPCLSRLHRGPNRTGFPQQNFTAVSLDIPVMIFTSVDLPAPFSPTRPWTRPLPMSNDTLVSAFDSPNVLSMPTMRRTGVAKLAVTPASDRPRQSTAMDMP